jgi:Xaa-Pro aminopeptidase
LTRNALVSPPYGGRLAFLVDALGGAGVDALLVTHPPNLRYLVGFDGSLGALLVSAGGSTLVVDGRYITSASARAATTPGLENLRIELADRSLEEAVARVVMGSAGIFNLGVEAAAISLSRFDRLSHTLGMAEAAGDLSAPRLRATEHLVERARMVKDDGEVATLRDAARRLSGVAAAVMSDVRAGRTEHEVAADIDATIRRAGFERSAFETIVASGPNSALPHARPGGRTLQPGDGVVLDFGGVYDGYCVDLTRTVQLAPLSEEFGRLFDAVSAAHAAAIRAVAPGVPASSIDRAARLVLEGLGLAEYFVHGTGHGLGLEVHEEPRLTKPGSTQTDETLMPGMVFTIEPGVYVPGLGGVRIEDDILVVRQGCEVLTDMPIDRLGRSRDE